MLALSRKVELGLSEKRKEGLVKNLEIWLIGTIIDCLGDIQKSS